ncbi:SDR family NAD(P)-dependent oxidoreductase [Georgenia alba]|uniref:SDR family NAD(P)-dependent oxidoreductase n=1 Tax=Georgenia alba TaxID=2233858 RepID=A0ABW2Q4C8_9MICO
MTLRDLAGQVVVVTGAGHGIGAAVARAAAEAGAAVALLDVDRAAVEEVALALGPDTTSYVADTTDARAVERAVDEAAARYGTPTALVNNAALTSVRPGGQVGGRALDMPLQRWRRVLDVNVTGAFICSQVVARSMGPGGGSIVNMASLQGLVPNAGTVDYCVSKAGLIMLTKCLAGEWAAAAIRVNAVAPGPIWTDPSSRPAAGTDALDGSWGTTEDVVDAVLYLTDPRSRFVNGHVLAVDGGASLRYRTAPSRRTAGLDGERG